MFYRLLALKGQVEITAAAFNDVIADPKKESRTRGENELSRDRKIEKIG